MEITDIVKRIKSLGIPIKYHHFSNLPSTPFAVYMINNEHIHGSDSLNLIRDYKAAIELYTSRKDFELQRKVEKLFEDVELDIDTTYIPEEKVYLTTFEFESYEKLY